MNRKGVRFIMETAVAQMREERLNLWVKGTIALLGCFQLACSESKIEISG